MPRVFLLFLLPLSWLAHAADTALIQSPNDPQHYRSLHLANGLQVLLVQRPDGQSAAMALNVETGYAQDPQDLPGLAHLVEHLLFLGSERYPEVDGYQQFVKRSAGSYNAQTRPLTTRYHLTIPSSALDEGVSRFAQLLAAPRFDPHYVERERHAVDAEYQRDLDIPAFHSRDAFSQALNPEHPLAKFGVGNLQTLRLPPDQLRERAKAFFEQHYSAERMKLVLLGPQSLDELQAMAERYFSAVPRRASSAAPEEPEIALPGQLPARMNVRVRQNDEMASFYFPVDYLAADDAEQSFDYLLHALNDGLGDYLKQGNLALSAGAGLAYRGERQSLLGINVQLSEQGLGRLDDVQASVFAYLKMLREQGVDAQRYARIAERVHQRFEQWQTPNALAMVLMLVDRMEHEPQAQWLQAPYRWERFDAAKIDALLAALTPDKLLRIRYSPKAQTDRIAPNFQTPYALQKVSRWPSGQALANPQLPVMANALDSENGEVPTTKDSDSLPTLLVDEPGVRLWYEDNGPFRTLQTFWRINLQSGSPRRQPVDYVAQRLWVNVINDQFLNIRRQARDARMTLGLSVNDEGLALHLSGARTAQRQMLGRMLEALTQTPLDAAVFERQQQRLIRAWTDSDRQELLGLMDTALNMALRNDYLDDQAKLAALRSLDIASLERFRQHWLSRLHVQAMVVGSLSQDDARAMLEPLRTALHPTLAAEAVARPSNRRLAPGLPALQVQAASRDRMVLMYLPLAEDGYAAEARIRLLGQVLGGDFFAQLRTEQQLGYAVNLVGMSNRVSRYLMLAVQSHDYDTALIKQRIDTFLSYADRRLATLDEAQLAPYRQALLQAAKRPESNLGEHAKRRFGELDREDFAWREHYAQALRETTVEALRTSWKVLRQSPSLTLEHSPDVASNLADFQRGDTLLQAKDGSSAGR